MNRKLVYYLSIVAYRSIAAYLVDMSEQYIMPSQHPEFGQVLNIRNTIWKGISIMA
jgi:hypothetical protein